MKLVNPPPPAQNETKTRTKTDFPPEKDSVLGRLVWDNYVVEKKIGQGGMGAVYRIRHRTLPETFLALKVLKTHRDAKARRILEERFKQEAIAAAAVGSHRVCKPVNVGAFDDGLEYIVMEYVEGRSLGDELSRRGALPIDEALKIALRIADTMAVAHEKGIIHRDLKPSNIMLVQHGQRESVVKLLDFGIARAEGALKVAFTAPQTILGTVGYMSPEAAGGIGTDGRTDVFSLGVILFKMLTGKLPFDGPNAEAVTALLLSQPTPSAAARRPPHLDPVPPAVEAILDRTLAKEARDRLTMAELRDAVHDALVAQAGIEGVHTNVSAIANAADTDSERLADAAPDSSERAAPSSSTRRERPGPPVPTAASGPPVASGSAVPASRSSARRIVLGVVAVVLLAALGSFLGWRTRPTSPHDVATIPPHEVPPVVVPPLASTPVPGATQSAIAPAALRPATTPLRDKPRSSSPEATRLKTPAPPVAPSPPKRHAAHVPAEASPFKDEE